jgi:hypothetical protein
MPWDDGIDWGIDDPLYTDDPYANWGGGAEGDGSEAFDPNNPYANWGGGPGGDGTDGSGDSGGGFDFSKLLGGLASGGSSILSSLGRALGLTNGSGALDLGGLLSLAALLGGGVNSINATSKASDQMKEAADKANQQAKDTLQPAMANYQPYITAGQDAIGKMAAFDTSPIGAKFVAAGPQSNLASQFNSGRGLSLGQLARKA